ncbi:hypothetical protein [Rubrobacter indicoceani]|uniref:hypothetical protein n=1 Tax=Rubrobacter indicoceani TaxID=2051957 RepID=UPI000E5A9E91|nr:hypothetical protein [Rubrobacter indicoceani]
MDDQNNSREWTGNAIDLRGNLEPAGIVEVVFEFEGGDTDSFTPKLRDEFQSYELHQMGGYIDAVIGTIRKGQRS